MTFDITFEQNLSKEDYDIVDGGLVQHLVVETGLSTERLHAQAFAFVVRIQDMVKAGIVGRIQDQSALFDTLWVDESLRRQGTGRRLLNEAETFAKTKGCTTVFLNTLSQENVDFYEKCGFVLEFARPKYLGGFTMYYFRKELKVRE